MGCIIYTEQKKKGTKYISAALSWKFYYHKCLLCGKKFDPLYAGLKHYCTGQLLGISTSRAASDGSMQSKVSQGLQKGPSDKHLIWSAFVEEN